MAGVEVSSLTDGQTAYHVHGERGPWVVLVHGLLTPMFAWRPCAEALASDGYRVLRYDQFGRGLSDRPALRYDPALYVRQLDELTRQLGIESFHAVSWSMGGVIACRYAARAPARVQSLTLIAPALYLEAPLKVRAMLALAPGRRFVARNVQRSVDTLIAQHLTHPERFPDYRAGMEQQLRIPGLGESFVSTLQNFAWNEGRGLGQLGLHPRPVFVVWGDQDQTTPHKNLTFVRALFPRASVLEVAGARHAVHLEFSAQVQPALSAFLRSATQPLSWRAPPEPASSLPSGS